MLAKLAQRLPTLTKSCRISDTCWSCFVQFTSVFVNLRIAICFHMFSYIDVQNLKRFIFCIFSIISRSYVVSFSIVWLSQNPYLTAWWTTICLQIIAATSKRFRFRRKRAQMLRRSRRMRLNSMKIRSPRPAESNCALIFGGWGVGAFSPFVVFFRICWKKREENFKVGK